MWSRHEAPSIFSDDDIKRLCTAFPPATGTPLQAVRSNTGFVNVNRTKPMVSELIGLVPGDADVLFKTTLSEIAERLDLQDAATERLLPWGESGWLLAEDKTIVTRLGTARKLTVVSGPRIGYQALCKALFSQADEEPIIITSFINNNGISENTFRKLVEEINASLSSNDAEVVQGYLLTFWGQHDELVYNKRYRRWLEEEVATIMKAADRYASAPEGPRGTAALTSLTSPKTIVGSTFQGDPPRDFLECIANSLCEMNFDGIDGHISRNCNGEIEFFPRAYLLSQQAELLQDLRSGKVPFLQYADLIGPDPRITDGGQFADDQLEGYAIMLKKSVVSKVYLESLVKVIKSNLEGQGWAYVNISEAKLVTEDLNLLLDLIRSRVRDLYDGSEIIQILPRPDYLFLADWFEKFCGNIENQVHFLAQEHWNKDCELKLPWPLVCEAVIKIYSGLDTAVVQGILEQQRTEVETAFSRHIRSLQEDAVLRFSNAWKEKVLVRLQNYRIGIQSLGDSKLCEELHSTLLDYTLKALVPEFLRKCKNKGLVRGRSLERNIEKLQQTLAGINVGVGKLKDPFASTMEAIDAFTKAIKAEVLTDTDLEERKAVQLREMVNSMKKDEDGPRLFLTLILVMHAAHRPGIVYTTGKYAPRLLKQLTDVMHAEKYQWLQRMKEAAKSGSMTSEEKAEIRAMAVLACEGPIRVGESRHSR